MKNEPWTIAEETRLRREFPYKTNAELGLEKSATFREDRKRDINRRASEALKKKYQQGSCISHFKKGVRSNPDGEFKPGHVESQETKLKRSEALKYTWKQKKIKERIRKIYGI